MNRVILSICLLIFGAAAPRRTLAQTTSRADSLSSEARARDEAFADWKVRYADNRAEVGREIKAVRREIAGLDSSKTDLEQQLTNLLNGSITNWNTLRTDYADPDQYADCLAVFAVIRRAIRDGKLTL